MNDTFPKAAIGKLWAFARGDFPPLEFERWFLEHKGLEGLLGTDLHWDLTADDYRNQDSVWKLRQRLKDSLPPVAACHCHTFRNVDHVPMGGEVDEDGKFLSDHVFASFTAEAPHSSPQWWRYLESCTICGTKWLLAQEERIFDEWFIARLSESDFLSARTGEWPERFSTYYSVLVEARQLASPCVFLDPNAGSLIWTVEDLLSEEPETKKSEIAHLLGISERHADRLIKKARASQR